MLDPVRPLRLRIGRNVANLRKLRGLSQEKLAELAGKSTKHIGRVERGQVSATIDVLVAIAVALDVKLAGLVDVNTGASEIFLITSAELDHFEASARMIDRVRKSRPRSRRRRGR
jgi:transcriptional regulator with XRE-family HTH domain